MSLFNDKLKKITLKEVLILIILLFIVQYLLNSLNIVHIDSVWIYILLILFFAYKLRNGLPSIKPDILEVFTTSSLKYTLLIVILNIFMSYGFLYLSNYLLNIFPNFSLFGNYHIMSQSILSLSLISTVFVSPIAEELIFRGVFINRFKLMVPPLFAVIISALFFASLHTYGSILSAFIFALCMSVLYLKTGNIFVAIFAHFLNNLIAETIVIIDSGKVLFTNGIVMSVISVLAIVSFVLISNSIIRELNKIK